MKLKYVELNDSFFSIIEELSNEQVGILMRKIEEFKNGAEDLEFDDIQIKYAWKAMKPFFDEKRQNYIKVCEKNRNNSPFNRNKPKSKPVSELKPKVEPMYYNVEMTSQKPDYKFDNDYTLDEAIERINISTFKKWDKQIKYNIIQTINHGLKLELNDVEIDFLLTDEDFLNSKKRFEQLKIDAKSFKEYRQENDVK